MSKLFNPPVAIDVKEGAQGEPAAIRYKRVTQRVTGIGRRWRVREGWWRSEAAREYFELQTPRFACMIYRDLLTGNWYLQRVYD